MNTKALNLTELAKTELWTFLTQVIDIIIGPTNISNHSATVFFEFDKEHPRNQLILALGRLDIPLKVCDLKRNVEFNITSDSGDIDSTISNYLDEVRIAIASGCTYAEGNGYATSDLLTIIEETKCASYSFDSMKFATVFDVEYSKRNIANSALWLAPIDNNIYCYKGELLSSESDIMRKLMNHDKVTVRHLPRLPERVWYGY